MWPALSCSPASGHTVFTRPPDFRLVPGPQCGSWRPPPMDVRTAAHNPAGLAGPPATAELLRPGEAATAPPSLSTQAAVARPSESMSPGFSLPALTTVGIKTHVHPTGGTSPSPRVTEGVRGVKPGAWPCRPRNLLTPAHAIPHPRCAREYPQGHGREQ